MSKDGQQGPTSPPSTRVDFEDQVCDRFESDWRSGVRPRIEDYLDEPDASVHLARLRKLLARELELRRGLGEKPTAQEYRERFPELGAMLTDSGFERTISNRDRSDPPRADTDTGSTRDSAQGTPEPEQSSTE